MTHASLLEPTLRGLLEEAVREVVSKTKPGTTLAPIALEVPRQRGHGDLAASIAMQLASPLKKAPLEIAHALKSDLETRLSSSILAESIERIDVVPPGFINFFLKPTFLYAVLEEVLREGFRYGRGNGGRGKKAMVEFVSANPTGALSVAHGRQAAVGDALANLLDFSGYRVSREYYLNDEGTQIDLLGVSILARAKESVGMEAAFPENGYKGAYIRQLAEAFLKKTSRKALESPRAKELARDFGVRELVAVIRQDLDRFGVKFDRWFSQKSLRRFGYLTGTLNRLKRRGVLYEKEGAWWLKSTDFGDDKDRVVIRSDGRLTYIAADIAYHRKKFERGFSLLVNLWGPDHHGYIPRLKAAIEALGFPPAALQVVIVQLCTLKRGEETIPMSTREGEFITSTQVVEEVGRDAARFFFLLRKADAHLEFDLALAKQHSLENPVYYIQYAHARISSILKNPDSARALRLNEKGSLNLLKAPEELELLRALREFPGAVEVCAKSLEPFGMVVYLQRLAEGFHRFYDKHRVLSDDLSLSAARLSLIQGMKIVLATGLRLLGVSAPEKM